LSANAAETTPRPGIVVQSEKQARDGYCGRFNMLKLIGGTVGFIFIVGLLVIIGLLMLIF